MATTTSNGDRHMRDYDDDDAQSSPYSRKVGDRLRVIRRQKRLSLQEVEAPKISNSPLMSLTARSVIRFGEVRR